MIEWALSNLLSLAVLVGLGRWLVSPRFGKGGVIEAFFVNVIGDLVAHVVFEGDQHFVHGFSSIAFWIGVAGASGYIAYRWDWFATALRGRPVTVARAGVPDQEALRRSSFRLDDLEAELRKQGITQMNDVEAAVLEHDGSVAVVKAVDTAAELRRLADALVTLAKQAEQGRQ